MNFTAMAFDNFGPPDVFHRAELDLPEPLDSQVLVEVEASSVNFADVMARQGKYPLAGPPYVTGIDFVGRVIKAGSDDVVDAWNVVDRLGGIKCRLYRSHF